MPHSQQRWMLLLNLQRLCGSPYIASRPFQCICCYLHTLHRASVQWQLPLVVPPACLLVSTIGSFDAAVMDLRQRLYWVFWTALSASNGRAKRHVVLPCPQTYGEQAAAAGTHQALLC